jgi:hypothetical protein
MSIKRVAELSACLFFLLTLSALKAQAQACGGSFAEVRAKDSDGKEVRHVTIELIAEAPYEKYREKARDKAAVRVSWDNRTAFKVSAQEAKEMVKQSPRMRTQDFCGNPLRQLAGSTKVKRFPPYEATKTDFGFCTLETYFAPFLLEISAPGYVTDYYIGPFLGGCGSKYEFILTKKK